MRTLYPLSLLFDTAVNYLIRISIPHLFGYTIVCDRWIPDILVDISVDIGNERFPESFLGRLFLAIANKSNLIVTLDAPDHLLDERRPEAALDPYTKNRRKIYRNIIKVDKNIINLFSNESIDENYDKIKKILRRKTIDLNKNISTKGYANVKTPILRNLLKNKLIILASNWTFQGVMMATWSERIFKFSLDILMGILFSNTIFNFSEYSMLLGLVLAHTINWLFNSNLVSILKFHGVRFEKKRNDEFITEMADTFRKYGGNNISQVIIMGSYSREEAKEGSDIDMRLIRSPGIIGFFYANLFTLYFRSIALLKWIPLDLFILDNETQLKMHMRSDEQPIIIFKSDARARTREMEGE